MREICVSHIISYEYTFIVLAIQVCDLGRDIAQTVSRWLPTAAARVQNRV
jgi:hypothetical protein